MVKKNIRFSSASVAYYLSGSFGQLKTITDQKTTVLLTDENVFTAHEKKFKNWNTIVLRAGEEYKIQATVDSVVEQLLEMGADRGWTLVGVGGGVITDLAGYVAAVYLRGIGVGYIPTSLLAMVDASIGGKNGIDVGVYKNMVGTIRQPSFILWDLSLLQSLPQNEWINGFAEIIKHASIKSRPMFLELEKNDLGFYQKNKKALADLLQKNIMLKTKFVQADEWEQGDRKLLNFGHTLGHALENQYELSHGQAISIGMTTASMISQELIGFKDAARVIQLLEKYQLPTYAGFKKDKVFDVLQKDKKKLRDQIQFVLLEKVGKAVLQPIAINHLKDLI